MTLQITTNNIYRPILNACELQAKHWKALGMDKDEQNEAMEDGLSFVVYKGYPIRLDDFIRLDRDSNPFPSFWHGYHSETFFSGLVIHLSNCGEACIIGHYFS